MSTVAASPMAQQVEKLLKVALDNGATELRLSGGMAPMLRINDQMRPLKTKALPAEEIEAMASAVMPRQGDPANFHFVNSLGRFQGMLVNNQEIPGQANPIIITYCQVKNILPSMRGKNIGKKVDPNPSK